MIKHPEPRGDGKVEEKEKEGRGGSKGGITRRVREESKATGEVAVGYMDRVNVL